MYWLTVPGNGKGKPPIYDLQHLIPTVEKMLENKDPNLVMRELCEWGVEPASVRELLHYSNYKIEEGEWVKSALV